MSEALLLCMPVRLAVCLHVLIVESVGGMIAGQKS
jgi:hypothetical protein